MSQLGQKREDTEHFQRMTLGAMPSAEDTTLTDLQKLGHLLVDICITAAFWKEYKAI